MRERPIPFTTPMVRAILDGKKTVTRRILKPQPVSEHPIDGWRTDGHGAWYAYSRAATTGGLGVPEGGFITCPYGDVGDRLWVRETHALVPWRSGAELRAPSSERNGATDGVRYQATWTKMHRGRWRPPMFTPRWASRINLAVTAVRVERLQDITEADAIAEGVTFDGTWWLGAEHPVKGTPKVFPTAVQAFELLWDSINGERAPWASNRWVWVVEFRRVAAEEGRAA